MVPANKAAINFFFIFSSFSLYPTEPYFPANYLIGRAAAQLGIPIPCSQKQKGQPQRTTHYASADCNIIILSACCAFTRYGRNPKWIPITKKPLPYKTTVKDSMYLPIIRLQNTLIQAIAHPAFCKLKRTTSHSWSEINISVQHSGRFPDLKIITAATFPVSQWYTGFCSLITVTSSYGILTHFPFSPKQRLFPALS